MQLFNGRAAASKLDAKISAVLSSDEYLAKGLPKVLVIIQIGHDESSAKYARLKKELCSRLGVPACIQNVSSDQDDVHICTQVLSISRNDKVGGMIIQVPLPRKNLNNVLDLIPEKKDLDLLSEKKRARYFAGDFSCLPPVVRATHHFLAVCGVDKPAKSVKPQTAILIGHGFLVGKPIETYLKHLGFKVAVYDDTTPKVEEKKLEADLLVLAAGVPNLIKGDNISAGCHVIDFGSSVIDKKLVGDLDMKSNLDHLGMISPSPGGMGPLVIRYLVMNHLGL